MTDVRYHYVPSLRRGLATGITEPATGRRVSLPLSVLASRRKLATGAWDQPAPIEVATQLYGPGDVTGFEPRIVSRVDPAHDVANFEPNYFPMLELAEPDYPWRFSPMPAAADGGLTPWITLCVLVAADSRGGVAREFEVLERGHRQRPAIRVFSQSALPDLKQAAQWVHVQATSDADSLGDTPEARAEAISQLLREQPELVVTRLLCPRRLAPATRYRAFVVPTFALGRAAGLDTPDAWAGVEGAAATDLAWTGGDAAIDLPYFYDWEFQTSERGDFEFLVRLLKPRALERLGLRALDCERPGFGLSVERVAEGDDDTDPHGTSTHLLGLEGALQSLDVAYTPWGKDRPEVVVESFQEQLAGQLLNRATPPLELEVDAADAASFEELSFDVLRDGRTLQVRWRGAEEGSGEVEYIAADDNAAVLNAADAVVDGRDYVAMLALAPERNYTLHVISRDSDDDEQRSQDISVRIPLPKVTPPIYGRWHAGRASASAAVDADAWLDVLNLDPRHRAAAGVGAEVVRKQQEGLMASAWDQIGAVDAANDIMRRAQLGRDASSALHQRLAAMDLDTFLQVTAPAQRRVLRKSPEDGVQRSVAWELPRTSRLPAAALSPAFRRMARPRGPLRKRQQLAPDRPRNLLQRLASGELEAAGPAPTLPGVVRPCDVSRALYEANFAMLAPTATLTASATPAGDQFIITLDWSTQGVDAAQASGDLGWSGPKPPQGDADLEPVDPPPPLVGPGFGDDPVVVGGPPGDGGTPSLPIRTYSFVLECEGASGTVTARAHLSINSDGVTTSSSNSEQGELAWTDEALRFCEERIECGQLKQSVVDAVGDDAPTHGTIATAACEAMGALQPEEAPAPPAARGPEFLDAVRRDVHTALDPTTTIPNRTRQRIPWLEERFEAGADGDPLDEVIAHPDFPQPMYGPLRESSESHILPGVETIPQNTVGLLRTNRRFVESYMVGLNHELAAELLWRRYPTDQRGSYFRQFWDVSQFIPDDEQVHDAGELLPDVVEELKDIARLHEWGARALGTNDPRPLHQWGPAGVEAEAEESLVIVIRGDLLKRYPEALIYAIDGHEQTVNGVAQVLPDMPEYGGDAEPIFPIFRGSLGSDLVFLGFPFAPDSARTVYDGDTLTSAGKFFVLEERAAEARFGLDASTDDTSAPAASRDDLSWGHFGLSSAVGQHLPADHSAMVGTESWSASNPARRARFTLQRPGRLVVHADQMMPSSDE